MSRPIVIGIPLTLMLFAAATSPGHGDDDPKLAKGREAAPSAVKEKKDGALPELELREPMLAVPRKDQDRNRTTISGFIELNGEAVILDRPITLIDSGVVVVKVVAREEWDEESDDPKSPYADIQDWSHFTIADENFDEWAFGGINGLAVKRSRLGEALKRKIARATDEHLLNEAQVEKLSLAGRGDIKRLFDVIEGNRREFHAVRSEVEKGVKRLLDLKPLIEQFEEGPFGEGSLYRKTLTKILDDRRLASSDTRTKDGTSMRSGARP